MKFKHSLQYYDQTFGSKRIWAIHSTECGVYIVRIGSYYNVWHDSEKLHKLLFLKRLDDNWANLEDKENGHIYCLRYITKKDLINVLKMYKASYDTMNMHPCSDTPKWIYKLLEIEY